MAEDLLAYYNRELAYLRKLGAEFADLHPKVAGRLRMSGESVEDPHVLRLLEGVAFLNARVRRKLDDEFPELTDALLGQLYPHYLAPIPSLSIVQFKPMADLAEVCLLPAGSEIETEPLADEVCIFRTTQDVRLYPIEITGAALTGRPLIGPASPRGAVGVVRLTLNCLQPEMSFRQLAPDSLRFFLRGAAADALPLYELLLNNVQLVVVANGVNDPEPTILNPKAVRPVGFAPGEGLLPYRPGSPMGYRLLTEYFAFPEKFFFFDVDGLAAKAQATSGRSLEIFLYLDRTTPELERSVSAGSFALGCAPMINLFSHRAEPIPLVGTTPDYQIVPDARRGAALEVYSVDQVQATSPEGEVVDFAPIYGLRRTGAAGEENRFWHAARRPNGADETSDEVFLSFVDLTGEPAPPDQWVASVQTTCSNRDLPGKLPFGGGHPYVRLVESVSGVGSLACLTAPSDVVRLPDRKESVWRLISHLNLNHLSLTDGEAGAEALREILRLYDFRDAPETRALIDSIGSIRTQRSTARAPDRVMGALCRGLDVTIDFDEQRTSGGVFLLASVIERFIGLYASINAFTRLTATVKGRSGVLRTWPPRAGDLSLL
jgi:type VI secretion system protein ImpG